MTPMQEPSSSTGDAGALPAPQQPTRNGTLRTSPVERQEQEEGPDASR
jgi:hypothetical protein